MQIDIKSTKTRTIIDFSKAGIEDLVVLGKYNYNRAEKNLEDHVHAGMIEICYYDKGSQWFGVDNSRYLVKGGDIFIHFPGEIHGSGEYPESKGCLYWFIIKCPGDRRIVARPAHTGYLVRELTEMNRRHFRGGNAVKKILEEIFKAMKEKGQREPIRNIRITLLAQLFLLTVIEFAGKKRNETDNERLRKVYDLIDRKITEDITIAMLAREAYLSESRFKNWFKEVSGFTPVDYVQRKRVDYAVRKIKEYPDISFRDLAYDLNFSSQQYFTTVVRKFTGKSPKEFRAEGIMAHA